MRFILKSFLSIIAFSILYTMMGKIDIGGKIMNTEKEEEVKEGLSIDIAKIFTQTKDEISSVLSKKFNEKLNIKEIEEQKDIKAEDFVDFDYNVNGDVKITIDKDSLEIKKFVFRMNKWETINK